ncbi:MAG: flagellar basal body-associated FliL family protein [Candidatus Latescibacterota bacterium]|nr:flagellar basal body-associated FliL family protein [Candidatus Latescibacterota bacterium]
MADEEMEEGGEEAPAGGDGGALKKYGPLAAIVLLVQVVLAWVVITLTLKGQTTSEEPEEDLIPEKITQLDTRADEESADLPFYYQNDLLTITANPAGTNAERFVVVGVELGLAGTDAEGEPMKAATIAADAAGSIGIVDSNLGLIISVILDLISSKYIDDIETRRPEIQEELVKELNQRVFTKIEWSAEEGSRLNLFVTEVIFTKLIIQ